jgi:hypothetical protein
MRYRRLAAALVLYVGFAAAAHAADNKAPIHCENVESIGVAHMSEDGVITLQLQSPLPGPRAEGALTYAPDDPQYEEIKQHLGGIAPGEYKPVRPWC